MCQAVYFPGRDEPVDTTGELREIWPTLIYDTGPGATFLSYEECDPYCLCPVDIEATAEANDAWAERDYNGDYHVIWEPRP